MNTFIIHIFFYNAPKFISKIRRSKEGGIVAHGVFISLISNCIRMLRLGNIEYMEASFLSKSLFFFESAIIKIKRSNQRID